MRKYCKKASLNLYTDYLISDDAQLQVGEMIRKHGGSRVLLVYDKDVKMLGLDKTVLAALKESGLYFTEMPDGVVPNPLRSLMEKGVEIAKKESIDFVLGMGGGSTIDTAKAIAIGLKYDGPVWDIFSGKAKPLANAPVGSIPTIAASGSESSRACVILDDIDTGKKLGCGFPSNRPVFCLLNPKLTFTVPKFQTACGAADAMGHTFNRYFFREYSGLADEFAAGLMRNVVKYAPVAVREPENYEARRELLLSAAFGHNDITELGRGGPHGGAHDLFSYLTFEHGAPHGLVVAMGFAPWIEWLVSTGDVEGIARSAKFATDVFGIPSDPEDLKLTALRGAEKAREFIRSIGLPATFGEYFAMKGEKVDLSTVDIEKVINYNNFDSNGFCEGYRPMGRNDVRYTVEIVLR